MSPSRSSMDSQRAGGFEEEPLEAAVGVAGEARGFHVVAREFARGDVVRQGVVREVGGVHGAHGGAADAVGARGVFAQNLELQFPPSARAERRQVGGRQGRLRAEMDGVGAGEVHGGDRLRQMAMGCQGEGRAG